MALAATLFLLTYLAIASERVHRTLAALLGALAMVLFGVLSEREAMAALDLNTLGLLIGMMVLVNVLRRTGCFQWLAVRAVKLARGQPAAIMILFFFITAVASALLDNVTTVLLLAPATLITAETLALNPFPLLIAVILASNIGGAATLIGDPPNIMIASRTHLNFPDFLLALAPVALLVGAACLGLLLFIYRRDLRPNPEHRQRAESMTLEGLITDRSLLGKSLIILGLVLVGFLLHGALHLQPSSIALCGAVVLLVISRLDPHEILGSVEWSTLFFFAGLFIVVGGVDRTGLLGEAAKGMVTLTGGNLFLTCLALLWLSGLLSAIVDNIPAVAALIPVTLHVAQGFHPEIQSIAALSRSPEVLPLWWSLALGACLGGNGSLIGASANVVTAGLAERSGHPISFLRFLKVGAPVTALSLLLSSAYIWLRYLQ
jgi:Na+/H+ antiporter NhaD/arsenite permease-like protein